MSEPGSGGRMKHYGTSDFGRLTQQIAGLREARANLPREVEVRIERLRRDQSRIEAALQRPCKGQRMVVIGPGQLLREARFFAVDNQVTCLDLDVIPQGVDVGAYAEMIRVNGFGRFAKTVGRKLIGNDRYEYEQWKRQLGLSYLPQPETRVGDICDGIEGAGTWDVLASWAVFMHLPDPDLAVRRVVEALRPGGAFYIGIHNWTSNTGHCDIRGFSGQEDALPLFGHLRPSQQHLINSSAWLNKVRIPEWREIFGRHCPGFEEYQERYNEDLYRSKMTPEIREELKDYADEELYTIDVFFCWRKPA